MLSRDSFIGYRINFRVEIKNPLMNVIELYIWKSESLIKLGSYNSISVAECNTLFKKSDDFCAINQKSSHKNHSLWIIRFVGLKPS